MRLLKTILAIAFVAVLAVSADAQTRYRSPFIRISSGDWYADNARGRIGINQETLTGQLDVVAATGNRGLVVKGANVDVVNVLTSGGTEVFTVLTDGKIGVSQATPTALLDVGAATTSAASVRIRTGTAPTSPNEGDLYSDGTDLFYHDGAAWVALTSQGITDHGALSGLGDDDHTQYVIVGGTRSHSGTTTDAVGITADSLTTGGLLSITSNSASTSTRNLVEIINDDAAATGTTALYVQNDSTGLAANFVGGGLRLDSNQRIYGNDVSGNHGYLELYDGATGDVQLGSTFSSSDIRFEPGNSESVRFTAAGRVGIGTDSPNEPLEVIGNIRLGGASDTYMRFYDGAGGDGFYLYHDRANDEFSIQDGSGTDRVVVHEAGSVSIPFTGTTTDAVTVTTDSLTSGSGLVVSSNSSNNTARNLVDIVNDHTSANNAVLLRLQQDGTGDILRAFDGASQRATINGDGQFSNTGGQTNSEVFGDGATTAGADNVVIGKNAAANSHSSVVIGEAAVSGHNSVVVIGEGTTTAGNKATSIGFGANANAESVAIGNDADATPGAGGGIAIGYNSNCGGNGDSLAIGRNTTTTTYSIAIGDSADSTGTGGIAIGTDTSSTHSSICLGRASNTTGNEQFIVGSNTMPITVFVLGNGATAVSSPDDIQILPTSASGTDRAGANFTLGAGRPTGAGAGGELIFETAPAGSTGTTLQARVERMRIDEDGNVGIGTASPTAQLQVLQSAAVAVLIDQNGNGHSIEIDSEATTENVVDITAPASTTGHVIHAAGDSLTTGRVLSIVSSSADTSSRTLARIFNSSSAATGANCLTLRQDSTSAALLIDLNDDADGIEFESAASTATGTGLLMRSFSSLTTGKIADFRSNSSDASARSLVSIHNDHTSATGATAFEVIQDAANQVMIIDQNADSSFIDFQGASGADTTSPVSTHSTPGSIQGWIQVEINGITRWVPFYDDPSA